MPIHDPELEEKIHLLRAQGMEKMLIDLRWNPGGLSDDELNRRNRDWLDRVNRRRNVHITGTTLDGRYVLRICVLSFRTHRDRMERCLTDLEECSSELGGSERDPGSGAGAESVS